jgi:serine/threonine protein phosphatase PrpC
MYPTATAFHHDLRRTTRLVRSDYPSQFTARSFAISCKGAHGAVNQDSYLAVDHFPAPSRSPLGFRHLARTTNTPGDSLFIVADGRGKSLYGSRASTLAIEVMEEFLRYIWGRFERRQQIASRRQILNGLRVAFDRADQFIWNETEENRDSRGMGAAVTAACTYRGDLFLAHAGDSQAFLWRAGKLYRLTRPALLPEEGPQQHSGAAPILEQPAAELWQTPIVGGQRAGVHVKLRMLDLEPNDYLVLCTKGLLDHVPDHIVSSTVSTTPDPQRICESLLAEAEKFTTHEDATVLAARFALAHE